jgi:putative antitoxin of VapBC-like toxin-antitoxin system
VFTSVEFDEELFRKAWNLSVHTTKKAFLDEALKVYVRLHEQAGVQSLRGKLVWDGDLSEIRETRGAGTR